MYIEIALSFSSSLTALFPTDLLCMEFSLRGFQEISNPQSPLTQVGVPSLVSVIFSRIGAYNATGTKGMSGSSIQNMCIREYVTLEMELARFSVPISSTLVSRGITLKWNGVHALVDGVK